MNGLEKVVYQLPDSDQYICHPYLGTAQKGVISAQTAFFKCVELKNSGFTRSYHCSLWLGPNNVYARRFPHANLYLILSGILNLVVMHSKYYP